MNKIFGILIFLSVQSYSSRSQEVDLKKGFMDSLELFYKKGQYCGNLDKIEIGQAITNYPFDSAKTIKLVSFKVNPLVGNKFDETKVIESVSLDENLKTILIDILVNYKTTPEDVVFCYEPRDAILFTNAKNELMGYINLCFVCKTSFEQSLRQTHFFLGVNCPEKWHLLKLIFGAAGITYGISCKSNLSLSNPEIDSVYNFVDESAQPEHGLEKYYQWVYENIRYPKAALASKKEGKVFVKFIIQSTGELTDIEVVKGFDSQCDKEALRVVSISPNWKPGKLEGCTIRQAYTIPISFKLPNQKKDR